MSQCLSSIQGKQKTHLKQVGFLFGPGWIPHRLVREQARSYAIGVRRREMHQAETGRLRSLSRALPAPTIAGSHESKVEA